MMVDYSFAITSEHAIRMLRAVGTTKILKLRVVAAGTYLKEEALWHRYYVKEALWPGRSLRTKC